MDLRECLVWIGELGWKEGTRVGKTVQKMSEGLTGMMDRVEKREKGKATAAL